ncbi:cupin domain-containing protein [Paracoccus sp. S-4012]|uniref:cupin domain-containing protein n=1 Tax=Paracoccus sp. S-4012 TaxID=2665648 RepID=UPI0012AEE8FB|nr:cupin domain-containing protein [Paracoccus sp. S-4012]MRX52287.1 cupin domain-containing protein [Paracoccus sp. S-4012]
MTQPDGKQVMLLQPKQTSIARQGMPQFFGVSESTVGARHLSMNLTAFPPGGRAKVHRHKDYETAIYTIAGEIILYYGPHLETEILMGPGSFCYIPAEEPHVAFNLSDSQPATALTARNDAREQENVVLMPELDTEELAQRIAARKAQA